MNEPTAEDLDELRLFMAPATGAATPRPAGSASYYATGDGADATRDAPQLPAGSASTGSPQLQSEQPSGKSEPQKDSVCYLVGTGRAIPGATKETNAARIMEILTDEATGNRRLPDIGRTDGGWCRKQFLKSMSGAGEGSWQCFKTNYSRRIDHSADWQWVRVGQGKELDPFKAAKHD